MPLRSHGFKALEVADALEKEGLPSGVVNYPSLKPIDEDAAAVLHCKDFDAVTAEEHQLSAGWSCHCKYSC